MALSDMTAEDWMEHGGLGGGGTADFDEAPVAEGWRRDDVDVDMLQSDQYLATD